MANVEERLDTMIEKVNELNAKVHFMYTRLQDNDTCMAELQRQIDELKKGNGTSSGNGAPPVDRVVVSGSTIIVEAGPILPEVSTDAAPISTETGDSMEVDEEDTGLTTAMVAPVVNIISATPTSSQTDSRPQALLESASGPALVESASGPALLASASAAVPSDDLDMGEARRPAPGSVEMPTIGASSVQPEDSNVAQQPAPAPALPSVDLPTTGNASVQSPIADDSHPPPPVTGPPAPSPFPSSHAERSPQPETEVLAPAGTSFLAVPGRSRTRSRSRSPTPSRRSPRLQQGGPSDASDAE